MKFGTRFAMPRRAVKLQRLEDQSFCATFDNGQTGPRQVRRGRYRRAIPPATACRLADFEGAGIYYAATEIEARHCRDAEAVIIGGAKLGRAKPRCFSAAQPATCGASSRLLTGSVDVRAIFGADWRRTPESRLSTIPK